MEIKLKAALVHDKKLHATGEILDLPDEQCARLIKHDYAVKVSADDDASNNNDDDKSSGVTNKLTKDELAQELTLHGIAFEPNASRKKLAEIYELEIAKGEE